MVSLITKSDQAEALDAAVRGDFAGRNPKPAKYGATRARGYMDCPRTYFWSYVVGYESPPSAAQADGTAVHSILEKYLRHGTRPEGRSRLENIALSGLEYLPRPGTHGLQVEQDFSVPWQLSSGAEIAVTGQMDFYVEANGGKRFTLGDHKTTIDLKYAKSPRELENDVQANLYAAILFDRFPSADFADLFWVFYQKKPPYIARPVPGTISRAQAASFVASEIEPAFEGMHALARDKPRLADVPLNRKHCDNYGGCFYKNLCWSKKAIESAPSNLVTIGATKSAAPVKGEVGNMGILAKQHGSNGATAVPQFVQSGRIDKNTILARAEQIKAKHQATDVNPPPSDPVPADYEEEAVVSAPVVAPAEAPKKARGRPRKDAPAGAEALVEQVAQQVEQAFATKTHTGSRRAPGYNPDHSYWLLIGATATRGVSSTLDVDSLVGAAQANAAEANGLEHYRKGGAYAILEWSFAKWLEENALKGVVRVPRALSPAARDVIGLLRAHADLVIEGEGA
jgi:hypothetical protein